MDAETARTALRITPFVVWGGLLVGWCLVVLPGLLAYVLGSPTTATVERCEVNVTTNNEGTTSYETTCYGSWPLGTGRGEGKIEGGGRFSEGDRVEVHGTSWAAATGEVPGQALLMSGIGVGLGVIAHGVCWWSFSRRIKKAAAPDQ
ncbi:hypothetical protein [Microlunatus sp. GCM10028923]|uniref:hypothetical protein n=1 Tax=Microlunatus sp. GCM10028923 TaxID=3273400 RepID=UPI00360F6DB3